MKKSLLLLLSAVLIHSALFALPACGKKTKLPATDYEKVVFAFEGVEKSFQKIGDKKTADLNDRAVGRLLSGGGDPLSVLRAIYEPGDSQGDVIDELEYDQPPMIQFQCLKAVLEKVGESFAFGTKYYDDMTGEVFFDPDRRQEIFQTAFLKLWTEISNRRISVREQQVCRQQRNGEYCPMTCSLTTFLMAFAKTEYRELVRNTQRDAYANLLDDERKAYQCVVPTNFDENPEEQKDRIIDECIGELPPRCAEILTLFYFKGMSLDEIMEARAEKNQSKNGLKTAKNKCMNTLRERITA